MHLSTILCGVFLSAVIHLATVHQDTGVVVASVGDNATLHCFYNSQVAMHFSWYRQSLGSRPELLSSIYKYSKPSKVFHHLKKNPRLSVQRDEGTNHLHISDVHLSDSATYFCGSSHSNMVEFGEGVFLSVKGRLQEDQEVVQEPVSERVQSGGSVTLSCTLDTGTCDGEHSVYWFRHGAHQGLLHTHKDHRPSLPTQGFPTNSCVYYLQRSNLSFFDAGMYYCAVASCGKILFGRGSELLVTGDSEGQMAQMSVLVWLSIVRIWILLFFVTVFLLLYITKKRSFSCLSHPKQ